MRTENAFFFHRLLNFVCIPVETQRLLKCSFNVQIMTCFWRLNDVVCRLGFILIVSFTTYRSLLLLDAGQESFRKERQIIKFQIIGAVKLRPAMVFVVDNGVMGLFRRHHFEQPSISIYQLSAVKKSSLSANKKKKKQNR